MASDVLVLLAVRWPGPGDHQEDAALDDVYRVLAEELAGSLAPGAAEGDYRLLLYATPVNQLARIVLWLNRQDRPILDALPQPEGSAARRVVHAADWAFRKLGAGRLVMTAAEYPGVDRSVVHQALASLEGHDLVVGKTGSGGIHTIAIRPNGEEPFHQAGAPLAADRLVEQARALGLRVDGESLPSLVELDTVDALARLDPTLRAQLREACASRGVILPD